MGERQTNTTETQRHGERLREGGATSPSSSMALRVSVSLWWTFVVLGASCGEAPPPERDRAPRAEASLSAASVKIAEPVKLAISVEHPEGTDALFPPVEAELGGLEVVEAGRIVSKGLGPRRKLTTRELTLRAFRTGAYTVEPLEIRLASKDTISGARKLKTPSVKLEVVPTLTEKSALENLRDVRGPFELEPEPFPWGTTAAGGVAFAVLAGGALWLVARRARREFASKREPPTPAHIEALRELRAIRGLGLLEEGRVAEFTDRVSDVLRRYLEARFELPAPERTTEEFMDEMARTPVLDRERKRFLADYLSQCDLVKFAAQEPGRRELDEIYDSSVEFVEETAQRRGERKGT